ncbi:ATP-binding protein [Nocardiopsis sp. CC223A]|uniref:ATP-binding protein n=1 Tax=Nocardiopsis sp. CC223A TaxID=3044051 RepID=UPI00278C2221|nr:ATP-binding protein [Nocardiopsis sp. CC223A]
MDGEDPTGTVGVPAPRRWRPVGTGLGVGALLALGLGTALQEFPDLLPGGGWWVAALAMVGSAMAASAQALLDRRPSVLEPPREPPVRPRLPAPVDHFTGHADLMKKVLAAFSRFPRRRGRLRRRRGGPLIIAITGEGGTGKSQFVSQVVSRVTDRFPDGTLEFELYGPVSEHAGPGGSGREPVVRRPAEILAEMLRKIGERVPDGASPERLSGLWEDASRHRRVLLVLDNAKDFAQVEPLLPTGPGCAVLITSRRAFPPHPPADIREHSMGKLSDEEGLLLLERLVSARSRPLSEEDRAALPELAARCHGFPFALCLVGAQATEATGPGAAALLRRMNDPEQTLTVAGPESIVRSLAFSLHECTREQRRLLWLLAGTGAATFTPWVAAALLDVRLSRAVGVLDELRRRYLVTYLYSAAGHEHFRLHEYMRDFLVTQGPRLFGVADADTADWSRARRRELEEAVLRLLHAYTERAEEAARRASPHEWSFDPQPGRREDVPAPAHPPLFRLPDPLPATDAPEPVAWSESEQRGFELCFWWIGPGRFSSGVADRRRIAAYGWRLHRAFSLLCRTGRIHWESMRESTAEAAALALETGDPLACAITLIDRAEVAGGHGDHHIGHELALTASMILDSLDDAAVDPRWRARAHRAIGVNLYRRGHLDDGRAEIDGAIRVFGEHRDTWWLVRSLCNLAEVYRFQGHLKEAYERLALAERELEGRQEASDQWTRVRLQQGEVLRLRGFELHAWFVLEQGRRRIADSPNGDWYHARYLRALGQLPSHSLNTRAGVCELWLDPRRERERRRLTARDPRWPREQEKRVIALFADGMPPAEDGSAREGGTSLRERLEGWFGFDRSGRGDRSGTARWLARFRLGERLRDSWQVSDQILRLKSAEQVFEGLGDTWGVMRTRLVRGQVLMERDRDEGKEEMLEAAAGFQELGDRWWHARAHRMAAQSLLRVHRTAEAEELARVAVEGYRGLRHRSGRLRAMKVLAQSLMDRDPLAAWRTLKRAERIAEEGVRLGPPVPESLVREIRDALDALEHGSGPALGSAPPDRAA